MPRQILATFSLTLIFLTALCAGARLPAQGTPVGFAEQWALATDRAAVLAQLIPGTRDHYYYHCRHHQDTEEFAKVEPLLRAWIQRHGRTGRVIQIENRQALLTFDQDPAKTLAFLQSRLGLRFDHERQMTGAKQNLPTKLDPRQVSTTAFRRRALQRHRRTVAGFRDGALESLLATRLDDDLLMSLLERLRRPDAPNLPALIVRNLGHRRSRGFGSLSVHRQLLLEQLDACAESQPALLDDRNFVDVYLRRLRPGADARPDRDAAERVRYLDRLHAFAQRLAPAHNSLKAHVLHHRLKHDLAAGVPDKARLLAYLRLPRQTAYAEPVFLRRHLRTASVVDANRAYPTGLPQIGNDEPLVRAYLMHFFATEASFDSYTETVRNDYLRRVFAEAKILAGVGDMERWYSLLNDPAYYESLKERVEIEFAATQRENFAAKEKIGIDIDVKNVKKLLVKVFEINTFNYYRQENREVDASINLDGLVANHEITREFTDSPLRRVRHHFDLPQVENPGVYVIELIGNGLSSRAVIHKGHLQFTGRLGAAGHVITVRDNSGIELSGASVWFGGKEYRADETSEIVLPYSTKPGPRSLILQHGGLTSLAQFQHRAEEYRLRAGIHLDRESLLARRKARILLRPSLQVNGNDISLDVLEAAVLTIRARDKDGVESSLDVRKLELGADQESVHEIQVPADLASIHVSLSGKVKNLSRGQTTIVQTPTRTFTVNQIDTTALTACPLLGRTPAGYVLDVLGKNGEPKTARAVRVTLRHRDYTDAFGTTLKTDARGRIHLGPLPGITSVQASGLPNSVGLWPLQTMMRTYPSALHGITGETIRVPYQGTQTITSRAVASLLETRDGQFVRDAFEHIRLANGFIELNKLPAGDFDLWLKEEQRGITVRITKGSRRGEWAIGAHRLLATRGREPLHITDVSTADGQLQVQLANASKGARVHVITTRYLAPFDAYRGLMLTDGAAGAVLPMYRPKSTYHSGRQIGDEYRYILDRRFATKYPGNMLKRPGVILNPWALNEDARTTAVGAGDGRGGQFGGKRGGRSQARGRKPGGSARPDRRDPGTFANLEFLPAPAIVLANVRADAKGLVKVPMQGLGAGQLIHVVAIDGEDTVYHAVTRAERRLAARGRHLRAALNAEQHFTEQRNIEFVKSGTQTVVPDIATAHAETYDSIGGIYRLFTTLTGDQDLAKFAFILTWPGMKPEEKRRRYEEHACHELHFFLHEKDPAFFRSVVRPYLANKPHKTFLDDWLLERDLSRYLEPWAFGRLNTVERILLAQKLASSTASIRRHTAELFDLQPRDPARLARLFDNALKSGALDEVSDVLAKLEKYKAAPAKTPAPQDAARFDRAAGGEADSKPNFRKESEKKALEQAPRRQANKDKQMPKEEADDEAAEEGAAGLKESLRSKNLSAAKRDALRRDRANELYRAPDPTRPYVEHNYWHRRNVEHNAQLVTVNGFWRDFAMAAADQPFLSTNVAEATNSFAEMMFALSVIDLPFVPGKHESDIQGTQMTIRAASPLLLVRKELVETKEKVADASPILVSQNYYRLDEPYRFEGNQRIDAYVTGEMLVDVAYGCRVVVTNPTSAPRKLELLLQIPQGAIPVKGSFYTKGVGVSLGAYATSSFEYSFYFPAAGKMPHYPVHVARDGKLVAFAAAKILEVVPEPSQIDRTSWQYISQNGTSEQVLSYLDTANLHRTDLAKIAWRMRDRALYAKVIEMLRSRHVFHGVLWSYAIRHRDADTVREYLRHQDRFLAQCGVVLDSPLVQLNPVERHTYQHIEYEPLFNARTHQFGKRREIHNRHFAGQYLAFLNVLGERRQLGDADWMDVTYYLLLQDRTQEALEAFARVQPDNLPMRVQHDYMRAYLDFFTAGTTTARAIANRYQDYPVERWKKLFADVRNQLDEIDGKPVAQSDPKNRTQRQTSLAAQEPALELTVESRRVSLRHRNVAECEIRYYEMDVEFLFSSQPFVQQGSGSFAFIRPNHTEKRKLAEGTDELAFDLPKQFLNSNVLIEVRAGGITRRQAYYANSLDIQWIENYGQIKVTHAKTGRPLRTTYVKVFARMPGGKIQFYKDGYTDLRGRFDYASISAENGGRAERLAVLVLSEDHGATIREVTPPTQ